MEKLPENMFKFDLTDRESHTSTLKSPLFGQPSQYSTPITRDKLSPKLFTSAANTTTNITEASLKNITDDPNPNTTKAPPKNIADDLPPLLTGDPTSDPATFAIPAAGFTFIIRTSRKGLVITLLEGHVMLTTPGSGHSQHWVCVEFNGWLGFRNRASGAYLGYDELSNRVICRAESQTERQNFHVFRRRCNGYTLLVKHSNELWQVGASSNTFWVEGKFERHLNVSAEGSSNLG